MNGLKLLMLSSECVPFVKTGGIADVVGSLPLALKKLGVDVRVALPRYGAISGNKFGLREAVSAFDVPLDAHTEQASILQGTIGVDVPVYFVENPRLYARDGIYMYPDDAERFIFFCRAALEMCRKLNWQPDVIHSHDWQTAIVPNWLKTIYADDSFFRSTASVYTIHNLAYQGLFGQRVLEIAGLAAYGFVAHPDLASDINQTVDFMARGILFGDALTTVSERYAREILTPEYGEKLDPILRARKDRLFGILNGIDYERFDPATEPHVPNHYDVDHLEARAANKVVLQREAGLAEKPTVPLIGMLSRLNDQKGIYLLRDTIEHVLANLEVQFVLIGTGDAELQNYFGDLARRYPGRAAYLPTFSQLLAGKLFAGSDIYLMPSRFEPAGTNQMIALRYGAVPVVRATGGLADTVQDFDPRLGNGDGFTFAAMDAWALHAGIVRAVTTYADGDAWAVLQRNGMRKDLSWAQSARRYVDVYQFAIEKRVAATKKQQALADDIAHTAQVIADLPVRIKRLGELAYNLWWTWNPDAQELFGAIDPSRWEKVVHNPVRLLREVSPARVGEAAANPAFVALYDRVLAQFDEYMGAQSSWFGATHPYATEDSIAYLSFEFGLHESLPIYSGGLGVLAGDTCKEASDLGLPFVAVGFLYPQGFFHQQIDADGNQLALEEKVNFAEVPAVALRDRHGRHMLIGVELPGRTIHAQLWRIQVGRIALIMMDTDIEHNSPTDRKLLAQLYQGDQEVRIAQEMVFGIGSVRALRAAGIHPRIWHLNEGHGAFLALELLRQAVQEGTSFKQSVEQVRAQTLFTTHTPVPAGNDAFPPELMDRYFGHLIPQLGVGRDEFMNLGMHDGRFSMTVLALRLSGAANGVSKLHGEVSRQMWGWLWPDKPVEQAPIKSITNGVHTASWLTPDLHRAFDQYLGAGWYDRLDEAATWDALAQMPDEELWAIHTARRHALIDLARRMLRERDVRLGKGAGTPLPAVLDPNILTIGFARRFATYKRATLIFRDAERLKRILNDPQCPMQIVFAGKAHPADQPGRDFIRQVYQYSQQDGFRGRILFMEEYNIHIARYLVAGVDVWLNNPRRPLEASGTSGMKASLNGIPTASILDGWWVEGYNEKDGWAIQSADARQMSQDEQDAADSVAVYETFEQKIVPLFYQRDERGVPRGWLRVMREAICAVAPQFSTRRMLKEYVKAWVDAMAREGAV